MRKARTIPGANGFPSKLRNPAVDVSKTGERRVIWSELQLKVIEWYADDLSTVELQLNGLRVCWLMAMACGDHKEARAIVEKAHAIKRAPARPSEPEGDGDLHVRRTETLDVPRDLANAVAAVESGARKLFERAPSTREADERFAGTTERTAEMDGGAHQAQGQAG